ncbi:MAG TPA: hypothetical protein VH500_15895 [Nitrososphaeraceae archaeon]
MIRNTKRIGFVSGLDNNKAIFVFVCILVIVLIVDTSIIKIYYFTINGAPLSWRVTLFIIITSIYIVGAYIIWQIVSRRSQSIRSHGISFFNLLHKIAMVSQGLSIASILIVVLQILLNSSYSSMLLIIATWISYSTGIIMLGVLAQKFLSWFRSERNYIVMLYAISSSMLAVNATFIASLVTIDLMNVPTYIQPHITFGTPFSDFGLITTIVNYGFTISSILSFILWWLSAAAIFKGYLKKSSKLYWIVFGLPLLYFLIQFQPLFLNLFSSSLLSEPVLFSTIYTIVFALSKPVGGVLFGIAFWIITRKVGNKLSKTYLISAAYGLVLVFVSNQADSLVTVPYPPFGLATTSFMGISSYLLLIGVYSSAVCVAEDSKLRQSIKILAVRESKFLHSIGIAQMQNELQKRVMKIVEKEHSVLLEQTGVEPSLDGEDLKRYLNDTIEEIKKISKK